MGVKGLTYNCVYFSARTNKNAHSILKVPKYTSDHLVSDFLNTSTVDHFIHFMKTKFLSWLMKCDYLVFFFFVIGYIFYIPIQCTHF